MRNRGREPGPGRSSKDCSMAYKLQVVGKIEKGEMTYKQAQKKYGIQGRSTVSQWLRKYGRFDWRKGVNRPEIRIQEGRIASGHPGIINGIIYPAGF